MKNLNLTFLLLVTFVTLSSCSKIIEKIYGMKSVKPMEEKTISTYCKKYNIPEENNFTLDTSYFSFLFSMDTSRFKTQIKNHYQPLQVLYYDGFGTLQSFQANCFAGGFPNLKWNRDSAFQSFIPKSLAPLDSILPLDKHLDFLVPTSKSKMLKKDNQDYFILVHWNRFMGRQTKRLIQLVQENARLAKNKEIAIIYVNNDDLFAKE